MTKILVYQTRDGFVLHKTSMPPYNMPWVGQRATIPLPASLAGPLFVEEVHGDKSGYVVVLGAP